MADLLRKGYTMLNLACPNCKNPIFRSKSGEMFCSKCNKPVIFSEDLNDLSSNKESEKVTSPNELIDDTIVLSLLHNTILEKLNLIVNQMHQETEISQFNNYIYPIRNLLKLLQQIQKLKKS